jgi:hypothetical protein
MSERVSSERRASKSGAKKYKPNKRKWVWLKSDIAKTHDRLRDAKIDLNIAMRLADQYVMSKWPMQAANTARF